MKTQLCDLVFTEENALDLNVCNFLIEAFHRNKDKHLRYDLNNTPNFTQYNYTDYKDETPQTKAIHDHMVMKVLEYKNVYFNHVGYKPSNAFNEKYVMEGLKIKYYKNDGIDEFATHIDVCHAENSRRFMSFLFYLNDVVVGGETVMEHLGISSKPKAGKIIVFPPYWMYPHSGTKPISGDKYICSAYLYYS